MMEWISKYRKNKKLQRIAMHLLFWLVSLGFFWVLFTRYSQNLLNTAIFIAILSPVAIFTTYFFNYRLIPEFLVKKKYFKFGWYGAITAVVALWIAMMGGIIIWAWRAEFEMGEVNLNTLDVPMLIAALFFVVFMGVSAKLIRINNQFQVQKDLAEKERLQLDNQLKITELKLLRDQLNPHFLFNTLNNLYGLTLEKSDKAPDLVMRLSNMLDYILYKTDENLVPLSQEINMVENYVSIEQHRFEGKYPITFEVKNAVDHLKIAPLLLLPLVENCFKHGIRKSVKNSYVRIVLKTEGNSIIFTTSNSIDKKDEEKPGGIGLENLKKRLEMIYPGNYQLELKPGDREFETKLTIQLSEV